MTFILMYLVIDSHKNALFTFSGGRMSDGSLLSL